MNTKADFEAACQTIVEQLRADVGASRTTLRVDIDAWGINVDTPVAEATAPGVASIRGATLRQRGLATVQVMAREQKTLVQNDCAAADPPPPAALLDVYGVKAQMLKPLVLNDQLVGWISAHYIPSPRVWSSGDVATLESAGAKVHAILTDLEDVPEGVS